MGRGIVSRGACLPCDPLRFSPRPADLCLAHISPPTPVHPPLLPQPHQPIDSPQYTDQSTDPPFISLRRAHFRVTARQHARRAGEGRSNKARLWCFRVSTETASQPRRRGRRQEAGGRRDRTKDVGARASKLISKFNYIECLLLQQTKCWRAHCWYCIFFLPTHSNRPA